MTWHDIRWWLMAAATGLAASPANAAASDTSAPAPAHAQIANLANALDMIWVLIAAALVLMMQIGFMLLEAGSVRTKNAISVAQKNLLDFCFAGLAFAVLGFGLAFGPATGWLPVGTDASLFLLRGLSGEHATFFIFQVMFCGTCATIVSGAVAERMRLRAYIVLCVVLAALIYPVFAQWAWGKALSASSGAFLAEHGFVDFAGSTVVHATGGWFALAACLVLGAREGRFDEAIPARIGGHSAVLASTGALFLFVGWIGFNGGSTLAASPAVPGIILNTVLAACAGGALGFGLTWFSGTMQPARSVNGMIGGLVAITAGCHLVDPAGALLLGACGGIVANGANHLLETRLRIDDAVGAVGAHGFAGVVGTLGLALVAPVEVLPAGSRLDQLAIQAIGSVMNFAWAFGIGLVLIQAVRPFIDLRVTAEQEAEGLNAAEHGVRMGTDHLQAALQMMVHSETDHKDRLQVEAGDENEHLLATLNSLMDKLQQAETEHLMHVEAIRDEEEAQRLVAFGEIASESIFLIHQGIIRSANSAASVLMAAEIDDLIGKTPEELVPSELSMQMTLWLQAGDDIIRKASVVNLQGNAIPVELRFRQMNLNGHSVVVLRISDLSEREEAQRKIYHLALHDPLTDLPNRELFNRRLGEALENQGIGQLTALLLIDVDRFKDINDLHGHPSGDTLLVALAERVLEGVRTGDTVARLGGDEFAVIQTGIAFPNQALDLAYRLQQEIGRPLTLPTGTVIRPRTSIGIALSPQDGEDAETLIRNADMALYSAKKRGRNGFQRYKAEMGRLLRRRQKLEDDLSQAVGRGELELHYQPRIDLASGRLASFEALVRWRREGELISPDDFISIAEDSGLIIPIGEWVIREACLAAANDLGGAAVSVNVSARQFQDPALVPTINSALQDSGLHPACLELEITESVLIEDDVRASHILDQLRALGLRVALDDFGTGYSSLSYLTRFRFDTIKIDRSFIQSEDERTWHVIRSVVRMSRGLNTSVVAEGVETQEQFDRLVAEGCDEIQGYLISRPMTASEAMKSVPSGVWMPPMLKKSA